MCMLRVYNYVCVLVYQAYVSQEHFHLLQFLFKRVQSSVIVTIEERQLLNALGMNGQ